MVPHKRSKYKDGLVWVEYCTVCGEDEDLNGLCPGKYVDKKQKNEKNEVDNEKEQN